MAESQEVSMDQFFDFIEKTTTGFMEKLLKDDNLLKIAGKWRDNALDFKNYFDKMISEALKNMNLPNKKDQEKTLHKINMLESQVADIEERIKKLAGKKSSSKPKTSTTKAGSGSSGQQSS
jgi:polyhydroxyalkanoate synthesis regulator phasin